MTGLCGFAVRTASVWMTFAFSSLAATSHPVASPLFFIENRGQADEPIRYYLQGADNTFAFTPQGIRFELRKLKTPGELYKRGDLTGPKPPVFETQKLAWEFVDANPAARITGENKLSGVVNYHVGEVSNHHAGVPTYASIRYHDLWPGIDVIYTAEPTRMKYELRVAPGADPKRIRFRYQGAAARVMEDGGLAVGDLRDARPESWQGSRKVSSAWQVMDSVVGFELGDYDRAKELVIDPGILVRSMVFGSPGADYPYGMKTDTSGNVYVTGTASQVLAGLTATNTYGGQQEVFVIKLDGTGALLYLTYLGGSASEYTPSIAADTAGNAYVTGFSYSSNFPIVNTTLSAGGSAGFLVKLAPTGVIFSASTLNKAWPLAVTVNGSGDVFLTGISQSGFVPNAGPASFGYADALLLKIGTSASATLLESRVIGSASGEAGTAIALDVAGNLYLGGYTYSANFPGNVGTASGEIGWIQKYAVTNLGTPLFSKTFGGSTNYNILSVSDIVPNSNGDVFVSGGDGIGAVVPWIPPTSGFTSGGGFLMKVDANGNFVFLNLFPSSVTVALDSAANIHISVQITAPRFGITPVGGSDVAHIVLSSDGTQVLCAQSAGGSSQDQAGRIALSPAGSAWIVGITNSQNFPVVGASGGLGQLPMGNDGQVVIVNFSCTTAACGDVSANSLSAWFPLEPQNSGNQVANTVTGVLSTVNGTKVYGAGAVGQALTFDGTSTYANVANVSNVDLTTTDFSIDFWMRIDRTTLGSPGRIPILDKRTVTAGGGASSTNGYMVYAQAGRLFLRMCAVVCSDYTSTTTIPVDNQYHLFAITVKRNSTTGVKFYVDAGAVAAGGDPTGQQASLTNSTDLLIGRETGTSTYFKGDLDEVEIFKSELPAAKILDIYNAGPLGKCSLPACTLPDLSATIIATNAAGILSASVVLTNSGQSATAGPVTYEIFLATDAACTVPGRGFGWFAYAPGLNPGQSVTVTQPGLNPGGAVGPYFLCVRVDPNHQIRECNENNNVSSGPVTLVPQCALPDFSVDNVTVNASSFNSGSGATITVTVTNAGLSYNLTPPGSLRILMATSPTATTGTLVTTVPLGTLPAGSTTLPPINVIVPSTGIGLNTGPYYFIVQVDPANDVLECNETNNSGSSPGVSVYPVLVANGGWREPILNPIFDPTPIDGSCKLPYCIEIPTDPCGNVGISISVGADVDVYAALGRPVGARMNRVPDPGLFQLSFLPSPITPDMIDHDLAVTGSSLRKMAKLNIPADLPAERRRIYLGYVVKSAAGPGGVTVTANSCTTPGGDPPCAGTPTDATAHYKLESATDPIHDEVNNLDGTVQQVTGNATYSAGGTYLTVDTVGKVGNSVHFATNGVAKLPDDPKFDISPNGTSVFAWVKFNPSDVSSGSANTIFGRYSTVGGPGHYLAYWLLSDPTDNTVLHPSIAVDDGVQGTSGNNQWDALNLSVKADGEWHCVGYRLTMLPDGRVTVGFFVDGVMSPGTSAGSGAVATNGLTSTVPLDLTILNSGNAWIGWPGYTANYNTRLSGSLDELRVFSRALTDEEMTALCLKCVQPIGVTLNTMPQLPATGYSVKVDDTTTPSTTNGPQTTTNSAVLSNDSVGLYAPLTWTDGAGTYWKLTNYIDGTNAYTPGAGSNTVTVNPPITTTYTAKYEPLCYIVTTSWTPLAGGTVTLPPSTIPNVHSNCYGPGTTFAVGVTPNAGFGAGAPTGTGGAGVNGNQVTVTAPGNVNVIFTPNVPQCLNPIPKLANLITWYTLDEAASPAANRGGGPQSTAAWVGNPAPIAGMVQGALHFGQANYAEAASAAEGDIGTGNFSIDLWIRTNDSSVLATFLDKRGFTSGTRGYSFFLTNGRLGFQLADGSGNSNGCSNSASTSTCTNFVSPSSSPVVADGNWHLIAVTVNRSSDTGGKLWLDGNVVLIFDPTLRPGSLSNTGKLRLGNHADGSQFVGDLDEVEIFNTTLDQADISAIFDAGSAGKCRVRLPICAAPPANMGAWYRFEELTPQNFSDSAGLLNDLATTSSNTIVSRGAGKVGQAAYFASSSDHLTVPMSPETTFPANGTIDLWIKPTLNPTIPVVDRSDATSGYRLSIQQMKMVLELFSASVSGKWTSSVDLTPYGGQWVHLAVTFDRSNSFNKPVFYVNGTADTNFTSLGSMPTAAIAPGAPMWIGAIRGPSSISPMASFFDELELIQRALPQGEIQLLVDADTTGKCVPQGAGGASVPTACIVPPAGMVYWASLDESGPPYKDLAGNNDIGSAGARTPGPITGYVVGAQQFGSNPPASVDVLNPSSEINFGTGDFSGDAWIKNLNGGSVLVTKWNADAGWIFATTNSASNMELELTISAGPAGVFVFRTSGAGLSFGNWYHVAFVAKRLAPTVDFYVNGIKQNSVTVGQSPFMVVPTFPVSNNAILRIGAPNIGSSLVPWSGIIDEVELFNRALPAIDIVRIYLAGAFGKCKPANTTFPIVVNTSLNPPQGFNVGVTGIGGAIDTYTTTVGVGTNEFYVVPGTKLNAAGDTRWDFRDWALSGGVNSAWTNNPQTLPVAGPDTYTANFDTYYRLIVTVTGTCTVSPQTGFYLSGSTQTVNVTLPPGGQLTFIDFSVSGVSTGIITNGQSLRIGAPSVLTVSCAGSAIPVIVNTNPPNIGSIVGIGGLTATNTYSASLPGGSAQTVTATQPTVLSSGTQYTFVNWSPSGPSLTLPAAGSATYTANYRTSGYVVTVVVTGGCALNNTSPPQANPWIVPANSTINFGVAAPSGTVINSVNALTGGASQPLNGPSYSYQVTGPVTISVACSTPAQLPVTVNTNPANIGATVGIAGNTALNTYSTSLPASSTQSVTATQPTVLSGGSQYTFQNWTPTGPSVTLPASGSATYTANYRLTGYQVSVTQPTGCAINVTSSQNPVNGIYPVGAVLGITVTANSGYTVPSQVTITPQGQGAFNIPLPVANLTVGTPLAISAQCTQITNVTLTVTTNPAGLNVRIGPSGNYVPGPISQSFPTGQNVSISTQTPQTLNGTGYSFANWSTGGSTPTTTVGTANNFTATANFTSACYVLTLTQPANGTLTTNATSVAGFQNCYAAGSTVTVTATPSSGYSVGTWTGGTAGGSANTRLITMSAPQTISVAFNQVLTAVVNTAANARANNSNGINLVFSVSNIGTGPATNVLTMLSITGASAAIQVNSSTQSVGTVGPTTTTPVIYQLTVPPGTATATLPPFNVTLSTTYTKPDGSVAQVSHTWNTSGTSFTLIN